MFSLNLSSTIVVKADYYRASDSYSTYEKDADDSGVIPKKAKYNIKQRA
jgi:hypothetical protein